MSPTPRVTPSRFTRLILPLVPLALGVAAPARAAPSFDCAKARSAFETAVCASPEASRLDAEIAQAYTEARKRLAGDKGALDLLLKLQRDYVREGDGALEFRMERQLAMLKAIDGAPRAGLTGRWVAPFGSLTFTPDAAKPGEVKIEIDFTHGTPPSFNICAWEGSAVPTQSNRAVSDNKETGARLAITREGKVLTIVDRSPAKAREGRELCSKGHQFDALLLAARSEDAPSTGATVSLPAPVGTPKSKIGDLVGQLPAEVFDATTDGIGADDLKAVIARGETEDWRYKRHSDRLARFTATHPSSTVTLRLKMLGQRELVEVAIQNEKVFSVRYFSVEDGGKALKPFAMRNAYRALIETSGENEGWPQATIPEPLARFADTAGTCAEFAPDLKKQGAEKDAAETSMKALGCARLPAEEAALRKTYAGKARWLDYLDKARALAGP